MSGNSAFWLANPSTGFYNGEVQQSGRFFGTTGYIDHQFSTPTSTQKMILAFWVKPSEFGDKQNIFGGGANSTNYVSLSFSNSGFYNANDQLKFLVVNSNTDVIIKITNRLFRDPSAWMHVCIAIDTTLVDAQSDRRVTFFFNGKRYTEGFATEHTPDENENLTQINSAMYHQIGILYAGADYGRFDGYLADFYFLDGQSIYSDTSATINSTFLADANTLATFCEQKNGVAIPKAYDGATSTYGNNGFRLEFKNNTAGGSSPSSSTFGADTSGKDNHFNDYSSNTTWQGGNADSPENNFCTLNPLGKQSASALSLGALRAVITSGTNSGRTPSTFAVSSGKWYWEVRQNSSNRFAMGVFDTDRYVMANEDGGSDAYEWVFITSDNSGNGARRNSNSIVNGYGGDTANGHVVMVALDVDNGAIYFGKQGTWFNNGTSDNSATVKSQIEAGTTTNAAYTGVTGRLTPCFVRQTSNNDLTVNFGQDDTFQTSSAAGESTAGNTDENGFGKFQYEPPAGFLALCSSNLPDTTFSPAQAEQANNYFDVGLYQASGGASDSAGQAPTLNFTDFAFQPDWVICKGRSYTDWGMTFDSARGPNKNLQAFRNYTENDYGNTLTSFNSDGFTLGADSTAQVNWRTNTYVTHGWKAGGAPTASNSESAGATPTAGSVKIDGSNLGSALAGSIAATEITASTTSGFSVVLYTGTGSAATVAHGLSSAPEFILVMGRSVSNSQMVGITAYNGWTHYIALSNAGYSVSDSTIWNNTAPTSSVFSVGTAANVNQSSATYVAYCIHSVEGFSKIGTYVGNSSTDGTFVYTGFRPAFVLVKLVSAGNEDFIYWDYKRDPDNLVHNKMYWNANNSEITDTTNRMMDFLANGFKHRTDHVSTNTGGTYMYMAFAEQPFKFSNGDRS